MLTAKTFLSDVCLSYYTDTMSDLELGALLPEDVFDKTCLSDSPFFRDQSLIARLALMQNRAGLTSFSRDTLRKIDFVFQAKNLMRQYERISNDELFPIQHLRFSYRPDLFFLLSIFHVSDIDDWGTLIKSDRLKTQGWAKEGKSDDDSLKGFIESARIELQKWQNMISYIRGKDRVLYIVAWCAFSGFFADYRVICTHNG